MYRTFSISWSPDTVRIDDPIASVSPRIALDFLYCNNNTVVMIECLIYLYRSMYTIACISMFICIFVSIDIYRFITGHLSFVPRYVYCIVRDILTVQLGQQRLFDQLAAEAPATSIFDWTIWTNQNRPNPRSAIQLDYLKLLILVYRGGLVADLDVIPQAPFRSLWQHPPYIDLSIDIYIYIYISIYRYHTLRRECFILSGNALSHMTKTITKIYIYWRICQRLE